MMSIMNIFFREGSEQFFFNSKRCFANGELGAITHPEDVGVNSNGGVSESGI